MYHLTTCKELKLTNWYWVDDEGNELDGEVEWDFVVGEINDIADELKQRGWDYFSAGGYGGWRKSASNTGIYELNGEKLRSILFCYDTEMNIVIDFTNVEKVSLKLRCHTTIVLWEKLCTSSESMTLSQKENGRILENIV